MKYSLHPEAQHDLREAAQFYRERAGSALSQSLFTEFERAITMLLENPRAGAIWSRDKRRYVMKRFPYSLIYKLSGEEIGILAIAHQSRVPGYWRGRK